MKKVLSKRVQLDLAGRQFSIETGKIANLADGSVVVRYGDTVVLATAVVGDEPREDIDYLPLMVEYEERLYAAGKISGSRFVKREGRPSEEAVLNARLIDRPLRPLFPKIYRNDVQVIITVLSVDLANDPGVISIIAGSAALMLTAAPFAGPVAAIRVGLIDSEYRINPTEEELQKSSLDLVMAGTNGKTIMLELTAKEISEEKVKEAISFGQKFLTPIIELQRKLVEGIEKPAFEAAEDIIHAKIKKFLGERLGKAAAEADREKQKEILGKLEEEILKKFEGEHKQIDLKAALDELVVREVRERILKQGIRPDGRKLDDLRPIECEVAVLPRTHGSGLFTRGETQVLTIATLGSPGEEQVIDTMEVEGTKRFMHHYNFPPFSTGEVRPMRGVSRREIGHGALVERALRPIIPTQESFPYTIRLVSEVLSSNGSSSMGSVCGATLALMDAGVPIKAPVAGIAIGLIVDEDHSRFSILTDIQGVEDFAGDMDFKVAGTSSGITAVQMDTKTYGLTPEIIDEALSRAKTAREEILSKITHIITAPRAELSPYAPRIKTIKISVDKIAEVIGPGGKVINKIISECGGKEILTIDIEEDGTIMVGSHDAKMAEKAITTIENITREVKVGEMFTGPVTQIVQDRNNPGKEIGAIVKITPNKEGMVHISQLANYRVGKVSDIVKVGDIIPVKVVEIDDKRGRISLSLKAARQDNSKPAN